MRITPPTRLLFGVVLLWVAGRVLGMVWAGGMAPLPQAPPSVVTSPALAVTAPTSTISGMTDIVGLLRNKAVPLEANPSPPPPLLRIAPPRPATALSTAAGASGDNQVGEQRSAMVSHGQLALFDRLLRRSPANGLTQGWRAGGPASSPAVVRAARPAVDRWTMGAWALVRAGNPPAANVGQSTLGGSQIGARLGYRLDGAGRWQGFVRVNSAGQIGDAMEGAVGVGWQPVATIPAHIIVERRQRLVGRDGRNAFAAYVSGGVSAWPIARHWRVDGYGAAGVVGVDDAVPFAEGQLAVTHAIVRHGRVTVSGGGGIWAGIQSGISRVDAGPRLTVDPGPPLPRVALDWRQRVAGDAAPASGPVLTLGVDF